MIAVESASVPSQSKTTNRNRRGATGGRRQPSRGIEARDERREVRRQRRLDDDLAAVDRMREADAVRVQEHPLQPLPRERLVPREIAVLVVAGERKAEVREVHADLVRAPGLELGFEQRERRVGLRPHLHAPEDRAREPAVGVHAHAPLAVAGHVARERQLDRAQRVAPLAADQHVVALVDRAVAQLRVQSRQRAALLGDEQHARRVAVEPVHELEERAPPGARARSRSMTPNAMPLPPWTASPAGLSSAISASSSNRIGGSATAARAASAPGLRAGAAARIGGIRSSVAGGQPRVRPDPAAVHPDLAAAQDPVDVALGDAFQDLDAGNCRCADPAPSSPTASQFTASLLKSFICLIIMPCSTLGLGSDRTIAAERRRTRSSEDGEGPAGQATAPRCGAKTAVACCVNRPPVKSTDRPGVAPRKSRDVKGRAQSPHPACGRFEAAHCAAHLATISVSGCPPSRPRMLSVARTDSREPRPLERNHEAHRTDETAPPRHCRGRRHAMHQEASTPLSSARSHRCGCG